MLGAPSILLFLLNIWWVYGAPPQVTQVNVPFVLVGTQAEEAKAALKRFITSAQSIMNCSLHSDPAEVLATADAAKQRFLDASAKLTAIRKEMTEAHKKQRKLDVAEDAQEDVVEQKKDAVRAEEGHVKEVKAQVQSLGISLDAELSAIDSMADQMRAEKQSVEVRQADLAKKLEIIRKKEKELQKIKGSWEAMDSFRVEREEHELKILKRDYDAAKKTLDADETRLRGGMQRLDRRSNRWTNGKDLIREAHDHLAAAEVALKQRQEALAINEAALRNLQETMRDHVALVKSVETALNSAEDDVHSTASSAAAAQGTAIRTLQADVKAKEEEVSNQQAAIEDAAVKHVKLESELRKQQKNNAIKDAVANGLKDVASQHEAALDHAAQAAALRNSQVEALRHSVAGKVAEVGKLRADNAILDDNAGRLRHTIASKTAEINYHHEKSIEREAQIGAVEAETARQEEKSRNLQAHINEVNADTAQIRHTVARHDAIIDSQSRELHHQDAELQHLDRKNYYMHLSNNELERENAKKDVKHEAMKDNVVQSDKVISIQGHELKQQDKAIEAADKMNAAKDVSIKALREEGARKDAVAKNLQKALDEMKVSEDKVQQVLDASRTQLKMCQGKGYEDHMYERLGDFIDVLSKSKPKS